MIKSNQISAQAKSVEDMADFTVNGEPVKDLEDKFKETIEAFLVEERLDSLVYESSEQEKLGNIYKKKGTRQAQNLPTGISVTLPPLVHIQPIPQGVDMSIPTEGWIESSDSVRNHLLRELASEVAWAETQLLVKSLLDVGREFHPMEAVFSGASINEASNWIRTNASSPDTMIVHPFEEEKLIMRSQEFRSVQSLPEHLKKEGGNHFSGILRGVNVYWTPAIPEKVILLYEKVQIRQQRTPLSVQFDAYNRMPEKLSLHEDYVAWSIDEKAVAKILTRE